MIEPEVDQLVREIDRERARLKRLLRGQPASALTARPRSGDWSILENVRHLLFAEQLHLGKLLSRRVEWSPLGLTSFTGREFAEVGTVSVTDIAAVFAAWDEVHRPIRRAVRTTDGDVQQALERNLRHLTRHITVIERLLRASVRSM